MRARLILAVLGIAAASPLAAQAPIPKTPPQLPGPIVLKDTVIVSSLALANGATFASAPISMNHVLLGKKPTHFRASKFADFHDAPAWITYPSTVPNFSGSQSGTCASAGTIKMVVHFQVRAAKTIGNEGILTFVHSNVARDTTCLMISG